MTKLEIYSSAKNTIYYEFLNKIKWELTNLFKQIV